MHTGIVCLPALKIKHFALGPQNVVVVCVFFFFWYGSGNEHRLSP